MGIRFHYYLKSSPLGGMGGYSKIYEKKQQNAFHPSGCWNAVHPFHCSCRKYLGRQYDGCIGSASPRNQG